MLWGLVFGILIATIVAVASLSASAGDLAENGNVPSVLYPPIILLMIWYLWKFRQLQAIPESLFPSRERIPSDQPAANWLERYHHLARRRSWPAHALILATCGAITWGLVPDASEATLSRWLPFAFFAGLCVLVVYGVWVKMRTPASAR